MTIQVPELQNPETLQRLKTVFGELVAKHGEQKLHRVIEAVQVTLGERAPRYQHDLQRPEMFFVPDLTSKPWYSPDDSAVLKNATRQLEAIYPIMREEYLAATARKQQLANYMGQTNEKFHTVQDGSQWTAFFLVREGRPDAPGMEACPRTARVIEGLLPDLMADGEAFFSVLKPGTVLPPHHDATNCKLTIHMAVIVPPECGLRVGGELKRWDEGRCVIFDDTFLHEAWNKGESPRVCFIMDVWHPDLTPVEIEAIRALVAVVPKAQAAVANA